MLICVCPLTAIECSISEEEFEGGAGDIEDLELTADRIVGHRATNIGYPLEGQNTKNRQ